MGCPTGGGGGRGYWKLSNSNILSISVLFHRSEERQRKESFLLVPCVILALPIQYFILFQLEERGEERDHVCTMYILFMMAHHGSGNPMRMTHESDFVLSVSPE